MTIARRPASLALTATAATLCLLAVLWQIRRAPESYPFADSAATSIYTLRAVKGELATGAYSRFQWHHPGPMLYQALAPLYALSGRREVSLKWTMLILNLAVLTALLTCLLRRAPVLAVTTALTFAPLLYFEQRLLFWAWNPVAPLLSLALAVILAAGIVAGDVVWLPWLCGVLSFLVQSHVGLAPVSTVLAGAALGAVAWRWRQSPTTLNRGVIARALTISAVVAVVLWAVPLTHSLRTRPGNLAEIAGFFASGHERHPWREVADVFANELVAPFSPSRELITGDMPAGASWPVRIWAVLQLFLLAGVAAWSRARGKAFEAAFAMLCLLSSAVGLLAIRSIVGGISDYLIIWVGVIGILNMAAVLSGVASRFMTNRSHSSATRGRWRAAVAIYVAAIAILGIIRLNAKQRAEAGDRRLMQLAGDLAAYCDQRHYVRPLLTFKWDTWRTATGLVLQFYKEDRMLAVGDDVRYVFGEPFARTGREPAEFYLMSVEDEAMPAGVTRFEWITTAAGFRVVQIFRN